MRPKIVFIIGLTRVNMSIPTLFFFNDTATTEIYTLSLHDALPIYLDRAGGRAEDRLGLVAHGLNRTAHVDGDDRRLVQDDALAPDVEPGVGRTQVYRQVAREDPSKSAKIHVLVALPPRSKNSRSGPRLAPIQLISYTAILIGW